MKIPGINCEYKKLNEYLSWCGTYNAPTMTQNAKNKIKSETNQFVNKLNAFYNDMKEKIEENLKRDNPNYNAINFLKRNWEILAYCFNEIKKKIISGEIHFDFKKFENDFSKNYASDKAKEKILELYLYADSPEVKNNTSFSWVVSHIQSNIKIEQIYNNGKYLGTMDLVNNKKHGLGKYTWKNGDQYVGDWQNDYRQGSGTYTWANGDKYVGEWENGDKNGHGEYFYAVNSSFKHYSGNWKNNKRCGKGIMEYKDGSRYTGIFKNDNRHGYGEMYYNDGASYSGIWENDKMSVLGRYDYADGDCYIGAFKNNKFSGFGVLYHNNAVTFGYFEDDEATSVSTTRYSKTYNSYFDDPDFIYTEYTNGEYFGVYESYKQTHGIIIWNDHKIYLGDFYDGEFNGYGVYLFENHDYYMGQWEDGDMNGNGYYYYSDGTCKHALWKNDKAYDCIKLYDIDGKLVSK